MIDGGKRTLALGWDGHLPPPGNVLFFQVPIRPSKPYLGATLSWQALPCPHNQSASLLPCTMMPSDPMLQVFLMIVEITLFYVGEPFACTYVFAPQAGIVSTEVRRGH